jgi:RNA polymerase sigma factor RpoE
LRLLEAAHYFGRVNKVKLMGDRDADRLLVERVQAGDKQAFGLLVTKYQRKLARLIGRMVRDPAEVEDIVQDSFIRAYRALPGFRNDSAFYTWLYRIGVNTAKNWLVTHGRKVSATDRMDGEEADSGGQVELLHDSDTPEHLLMTRQIGDTVNAAMEAPARRLADRDHVARDRRPVLRGDCAGDGMSDRHGALAHIPRPRRDFRQAQAAARRGAGQTMVMP